MTLVSEIISDAFRQSNITAVGASPTTAQQTEALRHLNRLVKSVSGAEAGEPLQNFPIGRTNISKPAGYPWYDNLPDGDWFAPKNIRAMLNLSEAVTIYLHPAPDDGSRFGVVDIAGNLATYNVTINGNGNNIETTSSITLNTNDTNTEWMYRADTGNWVKYSNLISSDTFPYPIEFDDFFITMLAIRLNPAYGASLDPQSDAVLSRTSRQLKARYKQVKPTRSEMGLLRLTRMAADRDAWSDFYDDYSSPTEIFNRGRPW